MKNPEDVKAYELAKFIKSKFLTESKVKQLNDDKILAHQKKALCLSNEEVVCSAAALTGGKGSSLAILNSIDGVTVPTFFCVTTHAFKKHFA